MSIAMAGSQHTQGLQLIGVFVWAQGAKAQAGQQASQRACAPFIVRLHGLLEQRQSHSRDDKGMQQQDHGTYKDCNQLECLPGHKGKR